MDQTTAISYQQTIHDDVSERALVLTKLFSFWSEPCFFVWELLFSGFKA